MGLDLLVFDLGLLESAPSGFGDCAPDVRVYYDDRATLARIRWGVALETQFQRY
jgi:hypothetical protein